jgi:hypothetical protein
MKKRYCFEIVRRANGRYGWRFVVIDDCGRRVLARSERTWRRRKRVRKFIEALQEAGIEDVTDHAHFPLPETSFRLVPGVLPLLVDEHPVVYRRAAIRTRARKRREAEEQAQAATK